MDDDPNRRVRCPFCGRFTARRDDGAFVTHARRDGEPCEGTGCISIASKAEVTIGGLALPVRNLCLKPGGEDGG